MEINSLRFNLGHLYKQIEKNDPIQWQNSIASADSKPIGQAFNANQVDMKSAELKKLLSNVNLRHISPHDLAMLGSQLHAMGEISDTADGEFLTLPIAVDGMDQNAPIDAIKFYEERYSVISKLIDSGEQSLDDAKKFLGSTLHALYNIDNFIHATGSGSSINERV